jgi:hypothetical protein
MNFSQLFSATEWRTKVAHGETVGFNSKMDQASDGAKEVVRGFIFCRPIRGLFGLVVLPTVSPWATFLRASGALAAMILFFAGGARAETTNDLSDAEIQGRNLARQLLEQRPMENFTNTGSLKIRIASGKQLESSLTVVTTTNASDWKTFYSATLQAQKDLFEWSLTVNHSPETPNTYNLTENNSFIGQHEKNISGNETMTPFAGSDFWICDLGLEFFHWPEQKVLKKEVHRSCGCTVLESTNPNPSTNGYSRVVSWIDNDSLGIVEAYAYDARGKLLKDFYPKDIKKVDGQWQVQTLVMENVQTGSRTRLEFDLKK